MNFSDLITVTGDHSFEFVGDQDSVNVVTVSTIPNTRQNAMVWIKHNAANSAKVQEVKANLVIVSRETDRSFLRPDTNYLLVDDPKLVFALLVNKFFVKPVEAGIHPSAVIHKGAVIGDNVHIGPNVVVSDNCRIGNNTRIVGNAFIYENVEIGSDCTLHAGCVIGASGSGYVKDTNGRWLNFPQIGKTVIEDGVEVGALTYINRGAIGETRIGSGSKIGLSVCVGHNVVIGRNAMIVANCVIAGSCELGDEVWVAHGALLRNGLKIGSKAFIGMGAVVTKNVEAGETVVGNPARKI
jgi:UDP-3-O-[3-hydroxymyristoyl] glucosamine N-acyltransferase